MLCTRPPSPFDVPLQLATWYTLAVPHLEQRAPSPHASFHPLLHSQSSAHPPTHIHISPLHGAGHMYASAYSSHYALAGQCPTLSLSCRPMTTRKTCGQATLLTQSQLLNVMSDARLALLPSVVEFRRGAQKSDEQDYAVVRVLHALLAQSHVAVHGCCLGKGFPTGY